jgi:hypothetical protein
MGQQIVRKPRTDRPARLRRLYSRGRQLDQPTAGQQPGGGRWSAPVNRAVDLWADGVDLSSDSPTRNPRATQSQGPRPSYPCHHEEHLMIITRTAWPGSSVVQSAIERPTAMRLAQTEYQRVADAVDALRPEDWTRPTDCTAWDVRQLVAHIAGQTNLFSTPGAGTPNVRSQGPATTRPSRGRRPDRIPGRRAAATSARGAACRIASRRPARGQGPPLDSRLPARQPPTGGGDRQRCTGHMVPQLPHRCNPHP